MTKTTAAIASVLAFSIAAHAQTNLHYVYLDDHMRSVSTEAPFTANPMRVPMPDIPGYHTYKADLHMHTIYSDGNVTPEERVVEAWYEDLDILAITDHQPSPRNTFGQEDMNIGYDKAVKNADELGIKLIKGLEITGAEPMGHINVLFVNDLNDYRISKGFGSEECDEYLLKARAEGAFITSNHPGWPDQNSTLSDYIEQRCASGLIQGMEMVNSCEFYPLAIDHARKYNLTMLSCTDSHHPTWMNYDMERYHRDMTLIFAESDSDEAIKEALFAHRTIAWAGNMLVGPENLMLRFLKACIRVERLKDEGAFVRMRFYNCSSVDFTLRGEYPQETMRIPAGGYAETKRNKSTLDHAYQVENTWIGSTEHLCVPLSFLLEQNDAALFTPFIDSRSVSFGESGLDLRLTCDEGETFYSLDGSEPSIKYGGAIHLDSPATVKARTISEGRTSGTMSSRVGFSMAVGAKARKAGVPWRYYEGPDILSTAEVETLGELKDKGVYPSPQITRGIGKDHFGLVMSGFIDIPETGLYQFNLLTNDGSDLYIGGECACNNDQHEGFRSALGTIYLQQGLHPYTIRYFEGYGGESFGMMWKKPSDTLLCPVPDEVWKY